jgi:hypothetical protein
MLTSPNRVVALILGAVSIAFGVLGFTATTGVGFFSYPGGLLVGLFEVNPAQNILHIALGVLLFLTGLIGAFWAQIANILVGLFLLALGLAGLFLIGSSINFLAINVADNVVHFAAAAVLLAVGLGAGKPVFPKRKDADA